MDAMQHMFQNKTERDDTEILIDAGVGVEVLSDENDVICYEDNDDDILAGESCLHVETNKITSNLQAHSSSLTSSDLT
jgi:hypothetical protein